MASYKSRFDPPTRPEPGWRPKKPENNAQASLVMAQQSSYGRRAPRDAEPAPTSRETERRPEQPRSYGRPTALPKVGSRGPSPAPAIPVVPPRPAQSSGFGFRRTATSSPAVPNPLALKPKHSRNVLRRKASTIAQHAAVTSPPELSCQDSTFPSALSPPTSYEIFATQTAPMDEDYYYGEEEKKINYFAETTARIIPELDRYRSITDPRTANSRVVTDVPYKLATHDLPPPTPLSSGLSGHSRYSGSATSTRFSESPGPGAYSRDTTPTSISSQSPGMVVPLRMTPRMRQASPIKTRPPLSRGRNASTPGAADTTPIDAQGLPSLRESLTSSSSNSTVKDSGKDGGKVDKKIKEKEKKKKKRLSPLPPSPPPRKSSQKFKKSPGETEEHSPSKASRAPARPVMDASPVRTRIALPKLATSSPTPPVRPSRDGTPDLVAQLGESKTVIQSNLSGLPYSPEKRRGSNASDSSVNRNEFRNSQSRLPARIYTSSPVQPLRREATPAPAGLGIIPDLRPVNPSQSQQVPASRTPSPSVSTSRTRFGLFRRAKTAPEVPTVESKERPTRKGPAAGTGHEGYGRYALRGRSSSSVGRDRSNSNASSSQESLSSQRTHDPFLLERMSPVVIAGGGEIVENRNLSLDLPRSESSQSFTQQRPSLESKTSTSQASSKSNLSKEVSRNTMWPSGLPANPAVNRSSISQAPRGIAQSDSSADEMYAKKPTLAFRRSMHRLKLSDDEELRLPRPIQIPAAGSSPSLGSQDTSLMSDDTRYGGKKSASALPKKLTKRPRSPRKWNFFQRSNTASPKVPVLAATTAKTMPIVIADAQEKSVAYYTMMDSSEQENDDPMDIEDILRDAEVVDFSKLGKNSPRPSGAGDDETQPRMIHMVEPKVLKSQAPPTVVTSPKVAQQEIKTVPSLGVMKERSGRPSRLPQVGRIPKVVPARPEQTSPKSFSRPFARVSMIQPIPNLAAVDQDSIAVGPSPERSPSPAAPAEPEVAIAPKSHVSPEQQRAFLVISPRKNSTATTSTSSEPMSFLHVTAVVPDKDAELEEDEVWDEYDDLIGNDDNMKVPPSATSSHGVPFQYEAFESRRSRRERKTDESPTIMSTPLFMDQRGTQPPRLALASSSVYSPDFSKKMKDAFGSLPTPTTPLSFTDFISGYGDRNNSVINGSGGTRRLSSPAPRRETPRPASNHSKSASMTDVSRQSADARIVPFARQSQESPMAQMNLRLGSMTVSKWLTFGHALFSPVREDILETGETAKHHSILVIDGLGNDDWSFYAAQMYPDATFYNLSATAAPSPTNSTSSSHPAPPQNHRQIQYTSTLLKFPFPREFFTCVVLRFPVASPDAALKNLVSESKRVLKPAGYLELSILDLDMMNMGNRCRRAVRGLKVQLNVADPSISLASASDTALRLLGKRGFGDVKSCRVGVPVASAIDKPKPSSTAATPLSSSPEKEISLPELLRDSSSKGDEGITKMVARVGRWWWMRCYEMAVLDNADAAAAVNTASNRSIFADPKVKEECEKWGTSFQLCVCYAQKPVLGRRRTASV